LKIPYADGSVLSTLHENHPITKEEYEADGTLITVLLNAQEYNRYKEYVTEQQDD